MRVASVVSYNSQDGTSLELATAIAESKNLSKITLGQSFTTQLLLQ